MSATARSPFPAPAHLRLLACLLLGLVPGTALHATALPCAGAVPLALGETWHDPGRAPAADPADDSGACFSLDLVAPGILMLDLSVAAEATRPWLRFLGPEAGEGVAAEGGFIPLRQLATSQILALAPGRYLFRVEPGDPRQWLPAFRLDARLIAVPDLDLRDELDSEIEIDPPPPALVPCSAPTRATALPAELLDELCHQDATDDHGDLFACATELGTIGLGATGLGATGSGLVRGELGDGPGDDGDLFRFQQPRLGPVEILAWGEVELVAELYDRHGQRLDLARGGIDGLRRVRTLVPGTYFLRLTGRQGDTGGYTLSVAPPGR